MLAVDAGGTFWNTLMSSNQEIFDFPEDRNKLSKQTQYITNVSRTVLTVQ